MTTTIQISGVLQQLLSRRKLFEKETYEEVIWDLVEDTQELSKETKSELELARAEIKAGKFHTFSEVKKKAGL